MQLVCEQCGAVGAAAGVEVVAGVVHVSCASCGHKAALGGTPSASVAEAPVSSQQLVDEIMALPLDAFTPGPSQPAEASWAAPVILGAAAPVAGTPASGTPVEPLPPVKCPKCGNRQHQDESCNRCGLVFARVADGRRPWESDYTETQRQRMPEAQQRFARVEQQPHVAQVHDEFVAWCRANDMMFFAAQRYAHLAADRPQDEVTQRYRAQVTSDLQAATMAMVRPTQGMGDSSRKVRQVMLVVVGIACVFAILMLLRLMSAPTPGLP